MTRHRHQTVFSAGGGRNGIAQPEFAPASLGRGVALAFVAEAKEPPPAFFFLAMADARAGQSVRAGEWLTKGINLVEKEKGSLDWYDRAIATLLRAEAERMIAEQKRPPKLYAIQESRTMSPVQEVVWDRYEIAPRPVRRFTVEEYHQLARLGFFAADERYELLDGWITEKPMVRNPPHDSFLDQVEEVISAYLPDGWRVRGQKAITLSTSEPDPDIAVVIGEARRYRASHPVPADIALVVEVADSSLSDDRGLKGSIYARDSLPIYWIVNLVDMLIEVYTDPTGPATNPHYRQCRRAGLADSVDLVLAGQAVASIPVAELLA